MPTVPIILTPEAVTAIKQKTALKEGAIGLCLRIKSTGCSGNSYVMEHMMESNPAGFDVVEQDGAKLFIPVKDSWMLFNLQIGYEVTKMSSGFTFNNPNESGRCGCGESFSVEKQTEPLN
jgi:iron-sulfur cluster assembly protein